MTGRVGAVYDFIKTIHVLSIATWFGSSLAITVIGLRSLRQGAAFGPFALDAGWWAGRAHPAAGVLLLLTGGYMTSDRWDFSELWIILAVVGLVVAMGIGGALIGRASTELTRGIEAGGGTMTAELRPVADRLLTASRLEILVLVLVIADMVIKPG